MPRSRIAPKLHWIVLFVLIVTGVQPAVADWLITVKGQLIETQGPWTIDGETLTYTDPEGAEHTFDLDDVDLEASEETTAVKAGRDYVPRKRSKPVPFELTSHDPAVASPASGDEPEITLYMTSWCGYCRKARKLLKQLDADFVAKDIEKNRKAATEFRKKNGGRGGVPLIDIDGKIVRGYNEKRIRQLVADLKEK